MELTADVIKKRSGHYDVSLVALLDVSKLKIRRLAQLDLCLNLLELNLAHNELRSLNGLPSLPLLRCLHLSDNQLTSLDTLPYLPLLEELTLSSNQIQSIDFVALSTKLPRLRVLDFTGNPLISTSAAKASSAFPNLLTLNGETLALARLFEEISSDDYGKAKDTVDNIKSVEANGESDDGCGFARANLDIAGVNEFINESSRNLTALLQQCKHTLATTTPDQLLHAFQTPPNATSSTNISNMDLQ